MPVTPVLQRLRQEDCCNFEAILCYIANTTHPRPPKCDFLEKPTSMLTGVFLFECFFFFCKPVLKVYTEMSSRTHITAYKKWGWGVGWAKLRQCSGRCNTGSRVDQLILGTRSREVGN